LGDLSGLIEKYAYDINNSGQVTGWVDDNNGPNGIEWRGYLWTPDIPNGKTGTFQFLGGLGTGDNTLPSALNNLGVVIGYANGLPFVWNIDDGIQDVNTLLDSSGAGWTITNVEDINDVGQIVGGGMFDPDGPGGIAAARHAFLLTPVPEPSSTLALTGLAMFFIRRRKPKA
jgi:hypothetical protein